jgi:hypothetical protein
MPSAVPRGGAGGGEFGTTGKITSIGDGELTLESADGKTYTVKLPDDTPVTVTGDVSSLKEGDSVTVMGTADSDGVISRPRRIAEGDSGAFPGGFGGDQR